jgi:hypothetical protein
MRRKACECNVLNPLNAVSHNVTFYKNVYKTLKDDKEI